MLSLHLSPRAKQPVVEVCRTNDVRELVAFIVFLFTGKIR
jgi:hypothetical protein